MCCVCGRKEGKERKGERRGEGKSTSSQKQDKIQDKTEKEKRGQRKESEETRVGDSREQSARLAASSKICVSYKVT